MTQIIKETISTQNTGNVSPSSGVEAMAGSIPNAANASATQQAEYLIYFFFGLLEALLAFRIVLKIAGASMNSGFVRAIYGLTGMFIMPFEGIFRKGFAQGVETTAVLEPAAIVAILVYSLLAWGIVSLVRISSGKEQTA